MRRLPELLNFCTVTLIIWNCIQAFKQNALSHPCQAVESALVRQLDEASWTMPSLLFEAIDFSRTTSTAAL